MEWQEAIKDLTAARDPIEVWFFADPLAIEEKVPEHYKKIPGAAKNFLDNIFKLRR